MLVLGMLVGSAIACTAFLVGYGCGHTNGFLLGQPEPVPAVDRPTPEADVVAAIARHQVASLGFNGTRGDALEVM